MNRDAIFWAGRLILGGIGIVLMFASVRRLGRARAAANWPTAAPVARLSAPLGWLGTVLGLIALAVAAGSSLGALSDPEPFPHTWRSWLIAGTTALVVVAAGLSTARRLVGRAELTALIRTPPREPVTAPPPMPKIPAQDPPTPAGDSDPAVPAGGESGWVYRDAAGDWYLAVATATGQRLVRLTDFALVPPGTAQPPLTLAGSVEISVWPVTERRTVV
jgi:hypothetical protein